MVEMVVLLLVEVDLGLNPLEVILDQVEAGTTMETLVIPGHLDHLDPLEVTLDQVEAGITMVAVDHGPILDRLAVVGPGIMVAPHLEDHHPDSLL